MEDEKNRERERLWNHPRPSLSRSTSSLDLNSPGDRQRTQSFPSRPDSAQSFSTPPRAGSWHSVHGGSRASSPASSVASYGRDPQSDPRNPVAHERERNWNSPHAKWEFQPPPRSLSPLPRSPSASHTHRRLSNASPSPSPRRTYAGTGSVRNRTVSLGSTSDRPPSPLVRRSVKQKEQLAATGTHTTPPRPGSTDSEGAANDAYGSRFGWPYNKRYNSPRQLDDFVPSPPGSRPSSQLSASADRPSRIPVRSPRKGDSPESSVKRHAPPSPHAELQRRLGHRRSAAEIATEIPRSRKVIEPVDLMNARSEDLVPTDLESSKC